MSMDEMVAVKSLQFVGKFFTARREKNRIFFLASLRLKKRI